MEGFEPGDAVVAVAPGSFASHVRVASALVVKRPAGLSVCEAASVPVNFLTASHALEEVARLRPGERVLIHSAAGGTGMAAVKVALAAGAEVFATASPGKWGVLEAMGIRDPLNSRTTAYEEQVRVRTGGAGVDVVLNSLTGEHIPASLRLLRAGGRFLEIGKTEIWTPERVAAVNPQATYEAIDVYGMALRAPERVGAGLARLMGKFERREWAVSPWQAYGVGDAVRAFRTMQQARHVGKLVVVFPEAVGGGQAVSAVRFEREGVYWIVGGLGGLGLELAGWMAERGAGCVVLSGRSEPGPEARERIRQLEAKGTRVVVERADAADPEAVAGVLGRIDAGGSPLRGVIHAAGVLADGVLKRQSAARFLEVLRPKVDGAWNLHTATAGRRLDHFVLFSSTASLLGWAGQGNHAAANAFLDGLAAWRRRQGLAGLSVNWGAWGTIGAAARGDILEQMRKQGMGAMAPGAALDGLERLMLGGWAQAGVANVDWERLLGQRPASPLCARFLRRATPGNDERDFTERWRSVRGADRAAVALEYVSGLVAKVLGMAPGTAVNPRQGFFELGLDSLTSVELRNALQKSLGGSLPSTLAFDYPNVATLAEYVNRRMSASEEGAEVAAGAPGSAMKSGGDEARNAALENLSTEELAEMLSRALEGGRE